MLDKQQHDTAAWVDQTLASHGAWDAVCFLLTIGRLSQENYEAWRLGEVETLEDVVSGSPKRIVEMLKLGLMHAKQRGLHVAEKSWQGWGEKVGQNMRLFADDALNAYFSCVYSPAEDRSQLDLFMDAQHVVCFNRIRSALMQRSLQLPALFDDAFERYADDPVLARLEALYVASKDEQACNHTDVVARFCQLKQEITPLAVEELATFSPQAHDFLSPLWRSIAQSLEHHAFDPSQPDLHASQAWLQAKAYDKAIHAVQDVEHWQRFPTLHLVMIDAFFAAQQIVALRGAWMGLCLHCPRAVALHINAEHYANNLKACGLKHHWDRFKGLEHRPSVEDFPAWLIIQQAEYLTLLSDFTVPDHEAGQRFLWVKTLLSEHDITASHIQLRRHLKRSSFWLFSMLLQKRPDIF